ncbi:MAG: hypothetical protein CM1200mP2_40830 [Planctomycetaceae bacterium]|nr:MAG: hypothetical protein CM1200mP2_40830 [Planctomycetaceae bacterium]
MSDASSRISAEDAAQQLEVSVDEILNLRRQGKIRGYPDYGKWVFDKADVAALAAEMGVEPTASDSVEPESSPEESTQRDESTVSSVSETADSPYQPASLSTEPTGPTDDEPDPKSSPYVPAPAPSSTSPTKTIRTGCPRFPNPPGILIHHLPRLRLHPGRTLAQLIGFGPPIDSARIIEALAERHGLNFGQSAGVVDGFWDHLLNPDHYRRDVASCPCRTLARSA